MNDNQRIAIQAAIEMISKTESLCTPPGVAQCLREVQTVMQEALEAAPLLDELCGLAEALKGLEPTGFEALVAYDNACTAVCARVRGACGTGESPPLC